MNTVVTFKPSVHQQRVFDFITDGKGSAIIEAVAGAGKTTTILQALRLIPATKSVIFLAFNRSIAEELKSKVPSHATAATFHSKGMGAWLKFAGKNVKVDASKVRQILRNTLGEEELEMYGSFAAKLVGLAKGAGLGFLVPDTEEQWYELVDHYGMELDTEGAEVARGVSIARRALARSVEVANVTIDYDDMLYMPLIKNLRFWQHDWVFVDEAQDTNAVQRALLKRMLKPTGRLVAVGDPHQAIYGFRGADSSAMKRMAQAFNCCTLPLTVSYRCPRAVVAAAQEYVTHIEAHPAAPEGTVQQLGEYGAELFSSKDAILCRNVAPLVDTAYSLMTKGVGCRVLGREIGQGLTNLIGKMKARDIETLETRLASYCEREMAKYLSKDQEQQAQAVEDKVGCITMFINRLPENDRTIGRLRGEIEKLFTDNGAGLLTLSTVHKSKGLEWDTVYLLEKDEYMPSKYARQKWQQEQEINLIYVAFTRAKNRLFFINRPDWDK